MNSEIDSICKQLAPLLDAFHDGELDAGEKQQVQEHVGQCHHCAGRLADIGKLVGRLQAMPQHAVSTALSTRLDGIATGSVPGGKTNVTLLRPRYAIPAAAAAVVALFIGVRCLAPSSNPNLASTEVASQPTPVVRAPITAKNSAPDEDNSKAGEQVASLPETLPVQNSDDAEQPKPAAHVHTAVETQASRKHALAPAEQMASQPMRQQPTQEVAIAEVPSTNSTVLNEALGISTDEDGLYDIKM